MSRTPTLFKRVFLPVLLLVVLAAFLTRVAFDRDFDRGLVMSERQVSGWFDPNFLSQWWRIGRVMELAHQGYLHPEKASYNTLANSALDHVLDGLDRYTNYMSPSDYEEFSHESDQRLVGVGVEIERRNGRIQILRVFPSSPAEKAKWSPGDNIVSIGDVDVREYNVPGVADLLKGPEDSEVNVVRERMGTRLPQDTLTRGGFDIPSIRDVKLRADGVGYLRLTQFGARSGQEFADAIHYLDGQGMRGLILDLRDNGGGLLDSAVDVLEPLLPAGQKVVSTRERDNRQDGVLYTTGQGDVHFKKPVVVLVNDLSASAAEIVTGALQDTHRAVIVGERTFGKGIVQTVMPLADGGALHMTTEAYFLPSGRTIQDKGITPDVSMTLSAEMRDLLRLQRADLLHLKPGESGREEFAAMYGFYPVPDPQIETAASLILAASSPAN